MAEKDELGSLLKAASFAARAHRNHMRKDKETPYVSHVFRVCLVLRDVFGVSDRRAMTAALLHDTIEDTNTDFDEIAAEFGSEIAQWVSLLSKDTRLEDHEREEEYCRRLREAPWQVQVCKLADVFDNLMDMETLPKGGRKRALDRAELYLGTIARSKQRQVQGPLKVVKELLSSFSAR